MIGFGYEFRREIHRYVVVNLKDTNTYYIETNKH